MLHPVPFVRGRISPLGTIATIRALRDVHRKIAPGIVHKAQAGAVRLGRQGARRLYGGMLAAAYVARLKGHGSD